MQAFPIIEINVYKQETSYIVLGFKLLSKTQNEMLYSCFIDIKFFAGHKMQMNKV